MNQAGRVEMATPMEEEEEESITYVPIEKLQDMGINAADIKKLKDSGFGTTQSVMAAMKKDLLAVKGLSEQKADKIMQASRAGTRDSGFITCSALLEKMKSRVRLSTGATDLDQMLGGGVESCSITELFGEFRCGKTQICHTLAVIAQLPPKMGGGNGKVIYIDTEGTFRPERIAQIAEHRGMSAQAASENIIYARCYTSDHLNMLITDAAALIVQDEDRFVLIVVDSIMGPFRVDYSGRSELAERQQHLGKAVSKLQKLSEEFNVAVVLTNQVMADPSGATAFGPSPPKPIGGHVLAHLSTTRISLRKGRGEQRVARIYDSPLLPESDCTFEVFVGGVRNSSD